MCPHLELARPLALFLWWMAKNIKLWARAEFCSTSILDSAASDGSLSSPAISVSHVPRDIWNPITKAPWVLSFPEVFQTTSDWPGQTLGNLSNPACQMGTCQHATCSGRKPVSSVSSSLEKYACFWHLSPLTLLHMLRQRSCFISQAISPTALKSYLCYLTGTLILLSSSSSSI